MDDPEAIRKHNQEEIANIEKHEQYLEENKYQVEHDGMSMRGEDDPEVLHPQAENFSPLQTQNANAIKVESDQIIDKNPNNMVWIQKIS